MIKHLFKLARKNVLKHKYYSFINVLGLTCGMLSALIIAKYVGYSLQFDKFHLEKDRIFAVSQEESMEGAPPKSNTATYWGVGELLNEYPEISKLTRYSQHVEALVIKQEENGRNISGLENRIFTTDSSFLRTFTFPLLHGDAHTALSDLNSMVLTESAAKKYFGNTVPLGKTLNIRVPWGPERVYEITGVMKDIPKLSKFKCEFLITNEYSISAKESWDVPAYGTFVLLNEGATATELSKKLANSPQLKATAKDIVLSLSSLTSDQLSTTQYLLVAVGIFVVLICWMNYINQVIAQSYWRIKEIGMQRVLGATRSHLRAQFIVESTLICMISMILVVGIYLGLEPALQTLTNNHLLPLFGDPTLINLLFLVVFILGLTIAAIIPMAILFSANFGKALRAGDSAKIGGVSLRKALVIVQFSISTILIIGIFVVNGQLDYLNTKDKGINMESVLIVKSPIAKADRWDAKRKKLKLFKDQCAALPFVTEVASSTTVPSEEYRNETFLSMKGSTDSLLVHQNGVDDHFFQLYAADFLAGEDFIPSAMWKNRKSIILNESAAKSLGIHDFEEAIDMEIVDHESDQAYKLIGIVKDYHKTPLKYELEPMAFKYNDARGHISLKINHTGLDEAGIQEKLTAIKQIWEPLYQEAYFDSFFLDKRFESQNLEDQYFGKLFGYFTMLSIIISCIGLFGISLLISMKRQREVSVRKVFGASAVDILLVFLKNYMGVLITSVLIGSLLGFFLMNMWLEDYAYRIGIGFGLISKALPSLILIFLFTISYHTIKSALANPVANLRG